MGCGGSKKQTEKYTNSQEAIHTVIKLALDANQLLKPLLAQLTPDDYTSFINTHREVQLKTGECIANAGRISYNKHTHNYIYYLTTLFVKFLNAGDLSDEVYILGAGNLAIKKDGKLLVTVQPGNCVGEIGFIHGSPRLATITAAKRCVVYKLSRKDYNRIVESIENCMRKIPLLSVIRPEDIPKLVPMCKIVKFDKNESVCMKGEKATQLFIIVKGESFLAVTNTVGFL